MSEAGVQVDPRLLEILVCPVTKGPLRLDREKGELSATRPASPIPSATAFRSCCQKKRAKSIDQNCFPRFSCN